MLRVLICSHVHRDDFATRNIAERELHYPTAFTRAIRVDAKARQLSSGDAIKIYNDRGEFNAKAHVTDDVPSGVVWIRDGWVGLNHLTSGDAVLVGDALSPFPFSVGQSDYGAKVQVARI